MGRYESRFVGKYGHGRFTSKFPSRFVGGVTSFSPLDLFAGGVVGAWYDPSDLTTLFQDSAGTTPVTTNNDPVGMMRDKSGNGNHLLQTTAGARPLYKTSGGKHWIESDDVNDWMTVAFTITQPWERVSAIRQIAWASGDRIFGGSNVNAGALFQSVATPRVDLFSGAQVANSGLAVGTNGVVTERHSGATSRIAVDSNAYVTGNGGTTVPAGLSLFCNYAGGVQNSFGSARIYGLVMRAGAMTDAQIEATRAYLTAKL